MWTLSNLNENRTECKNVSYTSKIQTRLPSYRDQLESWNFGWILCICYTFRALNNTSADKPARTRRLICALVITMFPQVFPECGSNIIVGYHRSNVYICVLCKRMASVHTQYTGREKDCTHSAEYDMALTYMYTFLSFFKIFGLADTTPFYSSFMYDCHLKNERGLRDTAKEGRIAWKFGKEILQKSNKIWKRWSMSLLINLWNVKQLYLQKMQT